MPQKSISSIIQTPEWRESTKEQRKDFLDKYYQDIKNSSEWRKSTEEQRSEFTQSFSKYYPSIKITESNKIIPTYIDKETGEPITDTRGVSEAIDEIIPKVKIPFGVAQTLIGLPTKAMGERISILEKEVEEGAPPIRRGLEAAGLEGLKFFTPSSIEEMLMQAVSLPIGGKLTQKAGQLLPKAEQALIQAGAIRGIPEIPLITGKAEQLATIPQRIPGFIPRIGVKAAKTGAEKIIPIGGAIAGGGIIPETISSLSEKEKVLGIKPMKAVTDQLKKFYTTFVPSPEKLEEMRVNKFIAEEIRKGKIPADLPLFKEFGMDIDDMMELADNIELGATFSGKFQNLLSQLKKVALKEFPEEKLPNTWWDKFAFKMSYGTNQVRNLWKSSLVSHYITSTRNLLESGLKLHPLQTLDDALAGVGESISGKQPLSKAFAPALEDIFAVGRAFKRLPKEKVDEVINVLDQFPLQKARFYQTPAQEVSLGSNYSNIINAFGRSSEFFARNIGFDASLQGDLRRLGKTLPELTDKEQYQVVKKAVDRALELTVANKPDYWLGKFILKAHRSMPVIADIMYAFPGYLARAMKASYDYSPLGYFRLANPKNFPKLLKTLEAGDPKEAYSIIRKATIGSALYWTATKIRGSKYAGEKWNEIKPNPDTNPNRIIDIRPFGLMIAPHLFVAEYLRRKEEGGPEFTPKDFIEGIAGINRLGGTTLFLTGLLPGGQEGIDKFKEAATKLGGEVLGGFATPFKNFKDLISAFSEEERLPRDVREEPLLGPGLAKMPFVSRLLPPSPAITRPGYITPEYPILKGRFPGATEFTRTPLETEMAKVGLEKFEIRPKTGVPEFDREIGEFMGDYVERIVTPKLNMTIYKDAKPVVKKLLLKEWIGEIKKLGLEQVTARRFDLIKERAEKILSPEIVELLELGDFSQLARLDQRTLNELFKLLYPSKEEK